MDKPVRVQLSRKKGWKMPENTVKVDRSTRWGNPITVAGLYDAGYSTSLEAATRHCVEGFRAWMTGNQHWSHGSAMPAPPDISALRGKNLACWCRLDQPCHADGLLELANAPAPAHKGQAE